MRSRSSRLRHRPRFLVWSRVSGRASKSTQLSSLEIGLEEPNLAGGCDSGYSCAYTNTISWRTAITPNPMEVNPRAVDV